MIKKVGFKRAVILLALTGALGVALFFNFFVFTGQRESSQSQLNTLNSEAGTLNDELTTMRANMERFNAHRQLFDTITKTGFFDNQERIAARARLDAIQKLSKVITARYEIRAAEIVENEDIAKTDYVIVRTPVSIAISALTDIDIYRFIYYLNYAFPGHVSITSLSINRTGEINQESLRNIGTGNPPSIVDATLEFTWTSMASRAAMLLPPRPVDPNAAIDPAAVGLPDAQTGGAL